MESFAKADRFAGRLVSAGGKAAFMQATEAQGVVAAAARNGNAYLAASGMQDVPSGSSLYARLDNPSGSGVNVWLMERWFDNNRSTGAVPLEYTAYPSPSGVLSQAATAAQLGPSSNTASAAMTWQSGADLITGVEASSSSLPTGGEREYLYLPFCLEPAQSVAFRIDAGDQVLQSSARCAISFVWFEEAV